MEKTFRVVPKGISLVVACATFPTWNTYPGLFASMMIAIVSKRCRRWN
jgi:hypothetical protein